MHDIDQTNNDSEFESYSEPELEYEEELDDEFSLEFEDDDDDSDFEDEFDNEFDLAEPGLPFSQTEELELASELLEVSNEEELDLFIRSVFRRAVKGARKLARRIPKRLRRHLRKLARRALPIAGKAIGGYFGGPAGGAIGGRLASRAGRFFGLELEGLSPEDQELEVAKRFVRLAGSAAKQAAKATQNMSANDAAKMALISAARQHAPGILRSNADRSKLRRSGAKSSGRWQRQGRKIVLYGV